MAASLAPAAWSAPSSPKGGRIGFVDYDLNGYHPRVFLKAMREDLRERGFIPGGCHALDESKSRSWAGKNDVTYFSDLQSLDVAVDFYMILAPSNPEVHLDLCQKIFPFRKGGN